MKRKGRWESMEGRRREAWRMLEVMLEESAGV